VRECWGDILKGFRNCLTVVIRFYQGEGIWIGLWVYVINCYEIYCYIDFFETWASKASFPYVKV
jgi:hypothetical protein